MEHKYFTPAREARVFLVEYTLLLGVRGTEHFQYGRRKSPCFWPAAKREVSPRCKLTSYSLTLLVTCSEAKYVRLSMEERKNSTNQFRFLVRLHNSLNCALPPRGSETSFPETVRGTTPRKTRRRTNKNEKEADKITLTKPVTTLRLFSTWFCLPLVLS